MAGFEQDKIYVSLSGRKGFHIEMFFDELMYTGVLKLLYYYVCKEAGLDTCKVEFRPTFTQAIKLPLGINPATGKVCWYINPKTFEPYKDPQYVLRIQKHNCESSYKLIRFLVGDDLFFKGIVNPKKVNEVSGVGVGVADVGVVDEVDEAQLSNANIKLPEFNGTGKYGYPMLYAQHMTHYTIVRIAMSERCKGLGEEDIEKRLNEWLDEQDEVYLTDPIPRIRKDIHDVVSWVYSDSFHVSRKLSVAFTTDDIKILIERRPRIQRQFLFVTLYYQKKFGTMKLGAEKIAEKIGCSRIAVLKSANILEKEGIIEITRQGALKIGNTYKPMPNIYRVIGKAKNPDSISNMVDNIEICGDSFQDMWKTFVQKTIMEDDWKKYFTAKEIKEIKGE